MKNKNTKCVVCHALIKTDDSVAINVRTGKVTHAKCYLDMKNLVKEMLYVYSTSKGGSKHVK